MNFRRTSTYSETAHHRLADSEIIEGLRNGDSYVIRNYFYDYCRKTWTSCRLPTSMPST